MYQGKRTILQFHHYSFQRLESRRNLDQTQLDGLIRTQQTA